MICEPSDRQHGAKESAREPAPGRPLGFPSGRVRTQGAGKQNHSRQT